MSSGDHRSWASFRGDESLLKRSVVLAARFCEHNADHCNGMNCMLCRAYLNTAAVSWKKLEKRYLGMHCASSWWSMRHTQSQGQSQVSQAQRRPFPLLMVGRTLGVVLDKRALSVLVSGQEGASWAQRGTSRKVLHGCQGHPGKTKPGAASPSVTTSPQHEASRAGPCPQLTQSDRALPTWLLPASGNVCSPALHVPLFQ